MRALALILLSFGTIAASVALAPIATMSRVLEEDLAGIAGDVTEALKGREPDAATRARMDRLWVTTRDRLDRLRADLELLTTALDTPSLVDAVEEVAKLVAPEALDAAEDLDAYHQEKVATRVGPLERKLHENVEGYPQAISGLRVLGRTLADERDGLAADLDRLDAALGPAARETTTKARERLATWSEALERRQARRDDPWGNPVWWLFAAGFVAMLGGIFLNRRIAAEEARRQAEKTRASGGEVRRYIDDISSRIQSLGDRAESLPADELHEELDQLIRGPLFDLTENRAVLETLLGIERYAMAMSTLASFERQVHRAWSALTDGYPAEARSCVTASLAFFGRFDEEVSEVVGRA